MSREEEEAGEGDHEDFDDNASSITASTAISGDRAGGALGTGAGDVKTVFGVDAEGTGTGDAAEVVHFVSAAERGARVRTGVLSLTVACCRCLWFLEVSK